MGLGDRSGSKARKERDKGLRDEMEELLEYGMFELNFPAEKIELLIDWAKDIGEHRSTADLRFLSRALVSLANYREEKRARSL